MVLFRPVSLICVVLLMCCAYGLFQVKYRVQNLRRDLTEINRQLSQERDAIHVLKAEWAYLNQPDRLRKIVAKHLSLEVMTVSQLQEMKGGRIMMASTKTKSNTSTSTSIEDEIATLLDEEEKKAKTPAKAVARKATLAQSRKKSNEVLAPVMEPILSSFSDE